MRKSTYDNIAAVRALEAGNRLRIACPPLYFDSYGCYPSCGLASTQHKGGLDRIWPEDELGPPPWTLRVLMSGYNGPLTTTGEVISWRNTELVPQPCPVDVDSRAHLEYLDSAQAGLAQLREFGGAIVAYKNATICGVKCRRLIHEYVAEPGNSVFRFYQTYYLDMRVDPAPFKALRRASRDKKSMFSWLPQELISIIRDLMVQLCEDPSRP